MIRQSVAGSDWVVFFGEVAVGLIVSATAGYALVKLLPRLQAKQIAYEDAPATHQQKTGTPTMGGIAMLVALLPLWLKADPLLQALLFLIFTSAAIGFLDDYMSIVRGRNRGLRASTKYLATALIAVIFLRMSYSGSDVLFHMGTYSLIVPHWLWLTLGVLAVTGTIHAVNLTDGLDGLVVGTVIPPLFVLWIVVVQMRVPFGDNWPVALPVAIGACLGFLIYNRHPAKMFMGDTGSLALGALLSGAAILTGEMLLLILIGGVFVAEALSVILQVAYFKRTKKRIFRMSPLHHHFELGGWPETKVTTRFWTASAALSLLGLAIVR